MRTTQERIQPEREEGNIIGGRQSRREEHDKREQTRTRKTGEQESIVKWRDTWPKRHEVHPWGSARLRDYNRDCKDTKGVTTDGEG